MHPDKLGLLVGLSCAALVLIMGWFLRPDGDWDTLYWSIVAFGVGWTLTFATSAAIYHIIDKEIPGPPKEPPVSPEAEAKTEEAGALEGEQS